MTDADFVYDLVILTNKSALRLEQEAIGISLFLKENKRGLMFLKKGAISTISVKSLTLVEHFWSRGKNSGCTESDVQIGRSWTTTDRLLIILKSDPLK